ncbi:uncharacterized protein A1O9_01760 [Exophiala aquamarina CBS 119918]|uniref:DUF2241 domain-containing protein n=1 Tax=Exophiala aquamarina CBS 119918 TaxID=1182545 RepID=A0A072PVQ0_9EURO|nr:uncharacterized protein A1O9_01760 [Exophiala aquamarina CBS 119918]KEF63782.1 hypothetical protein A1O9_01760 [Exophiala aquamarina CBS 119918]
MTPPAIGETSLTALLATLNLALCPTTYVFLTIPATAQASSIPKALLDTAILTFREAEGLTLIAPQDIASLHQHHQITSQYPCRMITCAVHSSLEAVGFLAVLTRALADSGISCNPVSGYFHDHLFVPVGKEEEAVSVLEGLVRDAKKASGEGGS